MENEGVGKRRLRDEPLVIGIDIGTTFSGAAWQQASDDEIQFCLGWPGAQGMSMDMLKVPSKVTLDDDGNVTAWGFEVADGDVHTLEWFKLALVADKDLPPHLRDSAKLNETKKKMHDLGVDATQVMAQFMDKIWTHALREIEKHIGHRDFESTPFHVVITIPAIWSNEVIGKMKTAATSSILQPRRVALTTYEFISEPEAAVQAYAQKLQRKLREGETVLVLDLGGGTGDGICYEKTGEGGESYLQLEEAAPGAGDLCGAIFADEAFEKLLLSKMPRKYRNIKEKDPKAWKTIISEQWHRFIKPSFEWKGKNIIFHVALANIDRKLDVQLNEDEIRVVLESTVMPKILGLIERLIEDVKKARGGKIPSIILPVGGFGRCPYILQRLREEFQPSSVAGIQKKKTLNRPEIEVHSDRGESPWGCVCKGASQSGRRGQQDNRLVTSRSSRVSVGFPRFVPGPAEAGGRWMQDFGEYMIPDVMEWVVKKGDAIDTVQKSTIAMYLAVDMFGTGTHSEQSTFYAYDDDSPPERYDHTNPRFLEYGNMKIATSKPVEDLPIRDSVSGDIRVFDYTLDVGIVGGSVQITATSAVHGDDPKKVGELLLPKLDRD